jgi:hypothetical protein
MTNPDHQHDSHQHRGGHELEGINAALLFRVTFGLSALTLVAAIFVGQWFYRQRSELAVERASLDDKVLLKAHRKLMQERLNGISSTINDVHSRQLLEAQPAPPGWVHPDDIGKNVAAVVPAQPTEGEAPSAAGDGAAQAPAGQAAAEQPAAAQEQAPAAEPAAPAAGQEPAKQPSEH